MKVRDKYEGCDPVIKAILMNGQEVLCDAETAEIIHQNAIQGHGPVKTWIVDYRIGEHTNNRFYFDHNGIAYRKVVPVD